MLCILTTDKISTVIHIFQDKLILSLVLLSKQCQMKLQFKI